MVTFFSLDKALSHIELLAVDNNNNNNNNDNNNNENYYHWGVINPLVLWQINVLVLNMLHYNNELQRRK